MLLTNDYQGAHQRELKKKKKNCGSQGCIVLKYMELIYFKMCSSLLIIYDTSQHTVSGSQYVL